MSDQNNTKLDKIKNSYVQYWIEGFYCFGNLDCFIFLILGFLAWLLPQPGVNIHWGRLLYLALIEEIIFRMFLQDLFKNIFSKTFFSQKLSLANLLASSIFALLHLVSHPLVWALSVFFPSLVFGWIWDKYNNVISCWIVHFVYNFLYFYRF